jgi:glucan phosphoethanolaminetransferase (alkaline phosphatase superfamily)
MDQIEARKFSAEIIRSLGYVLCTPACLLCLKYILAELIIENLFSIMTRILVSITLFMFGLICVSRSYEIINKENNYGKFY